MNDKERLYAKRAEMMTQVEALRNQIAGLDTAIALIDQADLSLPEPEPRRVIVHKHTNINQE